MDHLLECPIGPSLKLVQLRRLFDWANTALHQFFGAIRHPCVEVSGPTLQDLNWDAQKQTQTAIIGSFLVSYTLLNTLM